jgi:hypothetical protein
MTINNNKEDHKLNSDGGTLVMMCGREEEPQPSVAACWKIVMACTCCKAMDMRCW